MNGATYKLQRGITITKLLFVCVVVGAVGLIVMKLAPEYIEFWKLKNDITAIAQEANGNPNATVADVRRAFERRAEIDHIRDISSADLDVSKEGGRIVVSLAYQRKIPMIKNISVLIDFEIDSSQ
jgi:hypothetical protein